MFILKQRRSFPIYNPRQKNKKCIASKNGKGNALNLARLLSTANRLWRTLVKVETARGSWIPDVSAAIDSKNLSESVHYLANLKYSACTEMMFGSIVDLTSPQRRCRDRDHSKSVTSCLVTENYNASYWFDLFLYRKSTPYGYLKAEFKRYHVFRSNINLQAIIWFQVDNDNNSSSIIRNRLVSVDYAIIETKPLIS